jgi:2-hydroxychromene-2-carboxylate isomerase
MHESRPAARETPAVVQLATSRVHLTPQRRGGARRRYRLAQVGVGLRRRGCFGRSRIEALFARGEFVDEEALRAITARVRLDPAALVASIASERVADAYRRNLSDALAAGAWGVPTFVMEDGELFWGQDRLPLLRDHLDQQSNGPAG